MLREAPGNKADQEVLDPKSHPVRERDGDPEEGGSSQHHQDLRDLRGRNQLLRRH